MKDIRFVQTSIDIMKVKTRVKIAVTVVTMKIIFLFLICDFGHGYQNCAEAVLWTAAAHPLSITPATELEDLCGEQTWATGPKFLICVIFCYVVLDIVIYICFFYREDQRPPRREQVRFADGCLAFDQRHRPVMNL